VLRPPRAGDRGDARSGLEGLAGTVGGAVPRLPAAEPSTPPEEDSPVGGAAAPARPVTPVVVLECDRPAGRTTPDRADSQLANMSAGTRGDGDTRGLRRRFGCMAGIFQIFDRQRLIAGAGPRAARQAQKRLPPPSSAPPGN
jgi:hypothetical protein